MFGGYILKKKIKKMIKLFKKIKLPEFLLMNNFKVRTKLIIFFLFISIVPLTIVGLYSYQSAESTIENKVGNYSQELVKQAVVNINSKIKSLTDLTMNIITDRELMKIFEKKSYEDQFQKLQDSKDVDSKLSSLVYSNNDIKGISVLTEEQRFTAGQMNDFENKFKKTDTYQKVMDSGSKPIWVTGLDSENDTKNHDSIYIVRKLNSMFSGSNIGTLVFHIEPDTFTELYSDINLGDKADVFILDQARYIISHKNKELVGEKYSYTFADKFFGENKSDYFQSQDSLVAYSSSSNGWKIVTKVPILSLMGEMYAVGRNVLFIILICIAFAIIVSILISSSISKPIQKIREMMKSVENGDLTVVSNIKGKNEIAMLSKSFNNMIDNIRELVVQTRDTSTIVKENSESVNRVATQSSSASQEVSSAIESIAEGSIEQANESQMSTKVMEQLANRIIAMSDNINSVIKDSEKINTTSSNAVDIVETMNQKTQESAQVSQTIKRDINLLNDKTGEIRSIVDVIEGISEQTKLLSLNASIEAARAGEAGKGFSVVAEEVRKLAEQTNQATKNISQIVEKIFNNTQKTVNEVAQADEIFQEQEDSVHEADRAFQDIMKSIKDIVVKLNSVDKAMNDINEYKETAIKEIKEMATIAEESAASTEEVTAVTEEQVSASEHLSDLATQLSDAVKELNSALDQFDL